MSETKFAELTTDFVPEAERLDFWFAHAGGRMRCTRDESERPVEARVSMLGGPGIDFLNYESRGFMMDRSARMCAADGCDDISIGLALSPASGAVQRGEALRLRRGDLYVIDFARPVASMIPDHQELAIFLPRAHVRAAIGDATDGLGGTRLAASGIGGLLAAHMRALAAEAPLLDEEGRGVALRAASDLALATLRAPRAAAETPERHGGGLYAAALRLIEEQCSDHELVPEKLATALGISRAALYRLFARFDEGVAEAIWKARLDRARRLLRRYPALPVTEAAFRSGFLDLSSFARMYRRRFGVAPRDDRGPH